MQVCVKIDLEGDEYNLSLALSNPVNASKCSIKVYGTKVYVQLVHCGYLASALPYACRSKCQRGEGNE